MRRTGLILSAVVAVVVAVGVGVYLAHAQASARDKLRDDFAQRAALAAKLTGGALASGERDSRAFARRTFGGPERTVQAAVDADQKAEPQARIIVLRVPDGRVLGAYPHSLRRQKHRFLSDPEIARAIKGEIGYSNLVPSSKGPLIMVAVPFSTKDGLRIWWASVSAEELSTFVKAYLSTALGVEGGFAFLVDGRGKLLASSGRERIGAPLPNRALAEALRADARGAAGGDYHVSVPVPGTSWRVVFAAPEAALLAPARSTQLVAWQLFGAFVFAMACLLGLGAATLNRSARLAHERLHDALTGLPNRALFIDRTEQALAAMSRRGGCLAALFIDLDRFKRINDAHGHAVGDELLVAVAGRLAASMRSGDTLSRFGGDEFLVLCTELQDEHQATQIANRIQHELARPFAIAEQQLTVGCSIGIALHWVDQDRIDAGTLIHNADLAMYGAKQRGRARVELFDPTLGPVPA
ncbi:MAG: sensor domain-containing diguanylate cyclase [Actinomycetota bacterium]|nr:sensor domain-containing diguanylate cyclase [Actinomycetota bacterium]